MPGTPVDEGLRDVLLQLKASASLIAERLLPPESQPDLPTHAHVAIDLNGDRVAVALRVHAERRRRRIREGDDADLFGDPAWDILLDLYVHAKMGGRVSVSSACLAANVPASTGLRWLGALERRGLIDRVRDPADRRRTFVRLTAGGVELVERLLPCGA